MREQLRKLQLAASLALGSAPAVLLLFALKQPSLLCWTWAYPGAYFVLVMLGIRIPGKWRLPFGAAVAAASVAATVLLAKGENFLPTILAVVFYLTLFGWSLTIGSRQADWELPIFLRIAVFAIHLVAQFIVTFGKTGSQPFLTPHILGLRCAFLALIILTVFSLNRDSMNAASTVKWHVPSGMRQKNAVMTVAVLAIAILASFIPGIYQWIKNLVIRVIGILIRLLRIHPDEQQNVYPGVSETVSGGIPQIEETEPSLLWQILTIVFRVIGGLIFFSFIGFLLYVIFKKIFALLRKIWKSMEKYAAMASEDYQDEVTDTRQEASGERIESARRSGIRKIGRRGPMSPRETIRYRYQRLLRKHPEWAQSTTARENIPTELARLYEQARYSCHPIDESEAERFQTGSRKL